MKTKKGDEPKDIPTPLEVCYCDGKRELGSLELHCIGCRKWFHTKCFKDIKEFYGLPFMVSYTFHCHECAQTKAETWTPKTVTFSHMCIMAIANMVFNKKKDNLNTGEGKLFFDVEREIIPYFDDNWESLTGEKKRAKTTWHTTIKKTLGREPSLFAFKEPNSYSLVEDDMHRVGPLMDGLRVPGRKAGPVVKEPPKEDASGPISPAPRQTRGAKKKVVEDKKTFTKKIKLTNDFVKNDSEESNIEHPCNKDGTRFFLAVKDETLPNIDVFGNMVTMNASLRIPSFIYRAQDASKITISPCDKAPQLILSNDNSSISNVDNEGYCLSRATHGVSKGSWYFEVKFDYQSADSHIRVGWATKEAILQAPVGYTQYSYAIRSLHATSFHQAKGKTYGKRQIKEGDVIGCAIKLPDLAHIKGIPNLPPSIKNCFVIKHKSNTFFNETYSIVPPKEDTRFVSPDSSIEFFINGESLGVAFTAIPSDIYYPAISIYENSKVTLNCGPNFDFPLTLTNYRALSERVAETEIENCLSDILHIIENEKEIYETGRVFQSHRHLP
uniref:B30.2/SPRY domain-containing protein n=1 Tax=Rhabditophanes sp. KR3021 TaxID=114890 RepID=A0AC35TJG7_9BILA